MKRIIFIILALTSLGTVIKITFKFSADPLALLLFKDQSDNDLKIFFNIIPENYLSRFRIIDLDKVDDLRLKYVEDKLSSGAIHYIVLQNEENNKVCFLQAYYPLEKGTNDWDTHVSELINLSAFNQYIEAKGIIEKEQVCEIFFRMLSRPYDNTSFRVINEIEDIDRLLLERSPENFTMLSEMGYDMINISSLEISSNKGYVYCWIYNKGLVRFKFNFKEGRLMNVKSEIIGYLGNEVPVS